MRELDTDTCAQLDSMYKVLYEETRGLYWDIVQTRPSLVQKLHNYAEALCEALNSLSEDFNATYNPNHSLSYHIQVRVRGYYDGHTQGVWVYPLQPHRTVHATIRVPNEYGDFRGDVKGLVKHLYSIVEAYSMYRYCSLCIHYAAKPIGHCELGIQFNSCTQKKLPDYLLVRKQCSSCHYSDAGLEYCGKGLAMELNCNHVKSREE